MGVAGTAPAFSVAATTATLIAALGVPSAASPWFCGLIMFGITFAFMHMNRVTANAAASHAWMGQVFHPLLGFFAGGSCWWPRRCSWSRGPSPPPRRP